MVIKMKRIIYIQLLNEGSVAYRPVSSNEIGKNIFRVDGTEIYDLKHEEWEFPPGTLVIVEEQIRGGEKVLIAIKELSQI